MSLSDFISSHHQDTQDLHSFIQFENYFFFYIKTEEIALTMRFRYCHRKVVLVDIMNQEEKIV